MRDIFDKEFVKEMDDFFDYIDGIIGRDEDEVDVITDHLDEPMTDEEGEYWEMKAEIHNGIQEMDKEDISRIGVLDIGMDICRVPDNDDIR